MNEIDKTLWERIEALEEKVEQISINIIAIEKWSEQVDKLAIKLKMWAENEQL